MFCLSTGQGLLARAFLHNNNFTKLLACRTQVSLAQTTGRGKIYLARSTVARRAPNKWVIFRTTQYQTGSSFPKSSGVSLLLVRMKSVMLTPDLLLEVGNPQNKMNQVNETEVNTENLLLEHGSCNNTGGCFSCGKLQSHSMKSISFHKNTFEYSIKNPDQLDQKTPISLLLELSHLRHI